MELLCIVRNNSLPVVIIREPIVLFNHTSSSFDLAFGFCNRGS